MIKPPPWFTFVVTLALLWNVAGVLAIASDLSLTAADIAALSLEQQAIYAARPSWSIVGSVVAVTTGTWGCVLLLLKRRSALWVFTVSLGGLIVQDIGLFVVVGAVQRPDDAVMVMQALVAIVAVALLLLTRKAIASSWIK